MFQPKQEYIVLLKTGMIPSPKLDSTFLFKNIPCFAQEFSVLSPPVGECQCQAVSFAREKNVLAREGFPLDVQGRCDSMLTELVQSVGSPGLIGLAGLKEKGPQAKRWQKDTLWSCMIFPAEM